MTLLKRRTSLVVSSAMLLVLLFSCGPKAIVTPTPIPQAPTPLPTPVATTPAPQPAVTPVLTAVPPTVAPTVNPTLVPTPVPTPTSSPAPLEIQLFKGDYPPVGLVTYVDPDGTQITVSAVTGWVNLVTDVNTGPDQVASAATAAGATVIESNALSGIYTLSVPPGKEAAAISRLQQEAWVVAAGPPVLIVPRDGPPKPAIAVDEPHQKDDPSSGNLCADYHGDIVGMLMGKSAQRVEIVEPRTTPDDIRRYKDLNGNLLRQKAFSYAVFGRTVAEAMKNSSVVNISMGANDDVAGKAYVRSQDLFLAMVFRVAETGPDVPVVVATGNGDAKHAGHDFTKYVESLQKRFPNAKKRVRLVYAVDDQGDVPTWADRASAGAIGAPGEDVPIDTKAVGNMPSGTPNTLTCNGSSFSAPVVSGLVSAMRAASGKSAEATWSDFDAVTRGRVPWNWQTALTIPLLNQARGISVKTLTMSPSTPIIEKGKNNSLRVIARDQNGQELKDFPSAAYKWSSSDLKIARVDGSGFIDGVGAGVATITAEYMGLKAVAIVTVTVAEPAVVKVDPASVIAGDFVMVYGDWFTPGTTVTVGIDGKVMASTDTGNSRLFFARVSSQGLAPGSHVVTAKDSAGKQATVILTVTAPSLSVPPPAPSVTIPVPPVTTPTLRLPLTGRMDCVGDSKTITGFSSDLLTNATATPTVANFSVSMTRSETIYVPCSATGTITVQKTSPTHWVITLDATLNVKPMGVDYRSGPLFQMSLNFDKPTRVTCSVSGQPSDGHTSAIAGARWGNQGCGNDPKLGLPANFSGTAPAGAFFQAWLRGLTDQSGNVVVHSVLNLQLEPQ
ncbi:MAG: S8 family serine peptidase [Chloroflexi bacterium]|nr:S8 family serine peptidase [Chloroflexota bacterium]